MTSLSTSTTLMLELEREREQAQESEEADEPPLPVLLSSSADVDDDQVIYPDSSFDDEKKSEDTPSNVDSTPGSEEPSPAHIPPTHIDLSTYPYLPRCPTITDTIDGEYGSRPQGQLLFKRLRRDLPPPSARHYNLMIAALLSVMFLSGWNDASQGPLLPTLREHYHLDYLSVGFIWVCNFFGFLTAGLANVFITDRFGWGIAASFAAGVQAIGYCLMTTGGPYPLFLSAFILNGFGMGFLDALVSGLTTRLPAATTKVFLNYAAYGFGATISPLVSTQFVKSPKLSPFLYYSVSLALAVTNTVVLLSVFQLRTADQIVGCNVRIAIPMQSAPTTPAYELDKQLGAPDSPDSPDSHNGQSTMEQAQAYQVEAAHQAMMYAEAGTAEKMRKMFKSPLVHCLAAYSALYVGAEITIGGWAATFLQQERGGGVDVGYVSTGHFAGVTLGRLVLIPVAHWLGKHNTIYLFTLISIALEVVIWVVPNLIVSATCFSLLGFFLAPLYPILIMSVVDVLPVEIHAGTIGWVASLGCAGSALMPFITAGVSNKYGIWILQPLLVATLGLSLVLWAFVPRPRKLRA